MNTPDVPKMPPASLRRLAAYKRHIIAGMPDNDERKWKEREADAYEAAADKAELQPL